LPVTEGALASPDTLTERRRRVSDCSLCSLQSSALVASYDARPGNIREVRGSTGGLYPPISIHRLHPPPVHGVSSSTASAHCSEQQVRALGDESSPCPACGASSSTLKKWPWTTRLEP